MLMKKDDILQKKIKNLVNKFEIYSKKFIPLKRMGVKIFGGFGGEAESHLIYDLRN